MDQTGRCLYQFVKKFDIFYFSDLDYMYKGDDDTLIVPTNLANRIRKMAPESTAIGSLKRDEPVMNDIESKYFMPFEIEPYEKHEDYFSGAGYVLKGKFALEVAKARHFTRGNGLDSQRIFVITSIICGNRLKITHMQKSGKKSYLNNLKNHGYQSDHSFKSDY